MYGGYKNKLFKEYKTHLQYINEKNCIKLQYRRFSDIDDIVILTVLYRKKTYIETILMGQCHTRKACRFIM